MLFKDIIEKTYIKEITDELEAPEFEEIEIKDFQIEMSDGIKLMCHAAFPLGDYKSLPVILTRTPYGKNSLRFFHEMAFYGYICIAQDCRGCFESEGKWVPAFYEKNDGKDTLDWIVKQPWCDGNIALTGTSYLSMNQYLLADILPKEVKTLNLEVYSPYRYKLMYSGGMFHFEAYAGWLAYNSGVKGFERKGHECYDKMLSAFPAITADEQVFGKKIDWYRNWISSSQNSDEVWNKDAYGELPDISKNIKVPVLMHAGWYDPHFDGMMESWKNLPKETKSKSLLIITPTNHKQTLCGDVETPNVFEYVGKRFIKSKLSWFGHFLKGKDFTIDTPLGNIKGYVYGENEYKCFDFEDNSRKLYINTEKNSLEALENKSNVPLKYVYDPKNPVPTCGSEVIMTDYMYHKNKPTSEGRRLQKEPNYRPDVLSFVSEAFKEDTLIKGSIKINITVSSNRPDTAFSVKISTVDSENRAYFLRQAIKTLKFENKDYKPNEKQTLSLQTAYIAVNIKKGEKIRLDISSSDFPAFNVHPNTETLWCMEENPVSAENTIYSGNIEF